jgi:hypothetical protein
MTDEDISKLRADRDRAARNGDHAEALILNDRILRFKNTQQRMVECPSCKAWRDQCRLCAGTGEVTEQQALDFGAEP